MQKLLNAHDTAEEDAAAEAFGIFIDRNDEEEFSLWPENIKIINAIYYINTAWRHGALGQLIGLDFPQVMAIMRMSGIPRKDWPEILDGLRVVESEIIRKAAQ